jgi:hypothetical protein
MSQLVKGPEVIYLHDNVQVLGFNIKTHVDLSKDGEDGEYGDGRGEVWISGWRL